MLSKSDEKRRRILDAGLLLFARYGIRSTTLKDIALRARLAKPTLYYYFPEGKETIFTLAITKVVAEVFDDLSAETARHRAPLDKLRAYINARVRAFDRELTTRGVEAEVWEELKPLAWKVLGPFLDAELRLLSDVVAEGVANGTFRQCDPETVARVIQAAIKGLTSDGPIDVVPAARTRQLEEILALFSVGLLPNDAFEATPADAGPDGTP